MRRRLHSASVVATTVLRRRPPVRVRPASKRPTHLSSARWETLPVPYCRRFFVAMYGPALWTPIRMPMLSECQAHEVHLVVQVAQDFCSLPGQFTSPFAMNRSGARFS